MNVEIAERLAKRRREAGFSQEELAARLSVSRQAVSKWERSESSPDTDNLIALAKIYGVSLDDLLYVDEAIAEDVSYEAVDRGAAVPAATAGAASGAASKEASKDDQVAEVLEDALFGQIADAVGSANPNSAEAAGAAGPGNADAAGASPSGAQASGSSKGKAGKDYVHIGPAGIHVEDGEDSVHISWREGIHVASSEGDEVHVGWRGIHVTDPEGNTQVGGKWTHGKSDTRTRGSDGKRTCANNAATTASTAAVDANDASTTAAAANDASSSSSTCNCTPDFDGVTIEGEHFDTWHEAHAKYVHGWNKASAYYAFPFPLLAILVYLFLGIGFGLWGIGLLVFLAIPLYYLLVSLFRSRKLAPFLGGIYPLAATAWFLCRAFIQNEPHPAWVIFLTIPLVEWLIWSIVRWRRRTMQDSGVIDVDPMVK